MFKSRKIVAMTLIVVMAMFMGTNAFAQSKSPIITDNENVRVATVEGATATYDKNSNTMTITEGDLTYSFSLDSQSKKANTGLIAARGNEIVKEESVALHRYQYNKTDDNKYYWAIDIPSYSINPNNWTGWISVWDDKSKEAGFAKDFAKNIDDAQDAEHRIFILGGATGVAVIVGLVTQNPVYSESAFKAACAAAGIVVSYGILDAAADYFNNLNNARENYFAVRTIVG